MILQTALLGVLMLGSIAIPAHGQQLRAPTPSAARLARQVDSLFTRQIRPSDPGCAVGVYRDGQIVLAKGYGLASVEERRPITASTAFNIGSVAKPFTAMAALMLAEQGKLSLDDDVRRWIPELPDHGTPIRVRDLLQHTSGLRDYGAFNVITGREVATMPEFLARMVAHRSLNFATGTRHEYSHSDFVLLGLVIERVTGTPFGEHLERTVLAPMGMRGSFVRDERSRVRTNRAFGHRVTPEGTTVIFPLATITAGANLYTSVADLALWDRNFDRPTVGGPAVIAQMLSRPTLASGDTIRYAYGLRLGRYRGLRTVARGGHDDGTRSEIIRFPDQKFTVATLCNADHLYAGQFAQRVADIYLGNLMQPLPTTEPPPPAVTVAPAELVRVAGLYRVPGMPSLTTPIEVRDGALVEVLFDDARDDTALVMTPVGDGRFMEIGLTGNVGIFAFTQPADGGPMRLVLSWNGQVVDEAARVPDSLIWRPTAADLAEYEGTWHSTELGTTWRLERRGERLLLRRDGLNDLTLLAVERDMFARGFGRWMDLMYAQLHFRRDETGAVRDLIVSTPPGENSATGLRFVRIDVR